MHEKKYLIKLDYIRVIACILVLFYHLNVIKGGFLAVITFFTLSGYLTTIKALYNQNFSLKKYYLNRLKKIYLPLIIVISLTLIIYDQFFTINWLNLKKETISVLFSYNNFWQLDASMNYFTKHISSPFIHLWYISILIQFDLLFSILFVGLKKLDEKISKHFSTIIVFIITILSVLFFLKLSKNDNIMPMYYHTFSRLYSLLAGVLLAIFHYKYNFKISYLFKPINNLLFIIYSLILIILCFIINIKINNIAIYMLLVTLISMRLIEYSLYNHKNNNIITKIIHSISTNSYEIYLVQYPLIFLFQKYHINHTLKNIIIIILTFLIAYLIHFLINHKYKHKFIYYLKNLVIIVLVVFATVSFINTKDSSKELKELEKKLDEQKQEMDKKKEEYINNKKEEVKEEPKEEVNVEELVTNLPIVGIGDSVLLGAAPALYEKFPNGYFDGEVSRTIRRGEVVISDLMNQGRLPDVLILALANNGDYSDYINAELMELVGDREVYWISAVLADDPEFNTRFKEFAKNYPNIHIVEWEEASNGHPEYFYADGIHLKEEGMYAYANVIYDAILTEYKKKYNK
ncbi:MAG: acyltransferase [Bacilli bacterium]|nr:acyltransferase [Bacilli bacterium]